MNHCLSNVSLSCGQVLGFPMRLVLLSPWQCLHFLLLFQRARGAYYFRGVKEELPLDIDETFEISSSDPGLLVGSKGSTIFETAAGKWSIERQGRLLANSDDSSNAAAVGGGGPLPPFGTQTWNISGARVELNLNNCSSRTQFTCSDGFCVDMALRCNYITDCRDYSDEAACEDFDNDETSYNNQVADFRQADNNNSNSYSNSNGSVSGGGQPTVLVFVVRVDQVLNVDVNNKILQLKFFSELRQSGHIMTFRPSYKLYQIKQLNLLCFCLCFRIWNNYHSKCPTNIFKSMEKYDWSLNVSRCFRLLKIQILSVSM